MITIEQYVGPHAANHDWNVVRQDNADSLLQACAALEIEMVAAGVYFPVNPHTGSGVSGQTFGGFRPQDCPQGAPHSSHKEGLAVDRYDPHGDIDTWLMAHQDALERHGIYIEHPDSTKGWSHWSIKSPASGRHIFYP